MTLSNPCEVSDTFSCAAGIPAGQRVYAVGDVHGRADLLARLLDGVMLDAATRPPARHTLILLGDLVDRGPDTRGVLEQLATFQPTGWDKIFLRGNHEQVLLDFLRDPAHAGDWYGFGGLAVLASYGVTPEHGPAGWARTAQRLRAAMPPAHLALLEQTRLYVVCGKALFVHAGIERGRPPEAQSPEVLMWVRQPFLSDNREDGWLVVHGHTIQRDPQISHNRIGIDTGAYATGRLTALCLENNVGQFIFTRPSASVPPLIAL